MRRAQAEHGRIVGKKRKQRTKTVYILETESERALRKQVEKGIEAIDLVKGGGTRLEEV